MAFDSQSDNQIIISRQMLESNKRHLKLTLNFAENLLASPFVLSKGGGIPRIWACCVSVKLEFESLAPDKIQA